MSAQSNNLESPDLCEHFAFAWSVRRAARLAFLSAVCSASIAGIAAAETTKIAFMMPNAQVSRYEEQDRPNFERKVKELCSDCEVIYSNALGDATKQQQQFEAAISNGAKVIVMSSVDTVAAQNLVNVAKKANVIFVAYGRSISDAPVDYFLSGDDAMAGKLQGESLLEGLKKTGQQNPTVVVINGSPQDSVVGHLKSGFQEAVKGSGIKVGREYDTPDWSPEGAQKEMDQAITALGRDGFAGVYCSNDGLASGAIAAMKAAGIDPSTRPITGMDAETAALQRVLAGEQYMTVYWPLKRVAEAAAAIAVSAAKNQKIPDGIITGTVNNGARDIPTFFVKPLAVTKANMKATVIADGFTKLGNLCTPDFASYCKSAGLTE
jgi:D-xylose transport system substrate-binding protein